MCAMPNWAPVLGAGVADAVTGYQRALLELPKLRDQQAEFEQRKQLRPLDLDLQRLQLEQKRRELNSPKPFGFSGGYGLWNPQTQQYDVHEKPLATRQPTRMDQIIHYIERGQRQGATPQEQEISQALLTDLQSKGWNAQSLEEYRNRTAGVREDEQARKGRMEPYQVQLLQSQAEAQRSRVEQVRETVRRLRSEEELHKAQAEHLKTSDAVQAGSLVIRAQHEARTAEQAEQRLRLEEQRLAGYERNIDSQIDFRAAQSTRPPKADEAFKQRGYQVIEELLGKPVAEWTDEDLARNDVQSMLDRIRGRSDIVSGPWGFGSRSQAGETLNPSRQPSATPGSMSQPSQSQWKVDTQRKPPVVKAVETYKQHYQQIGVQEAIADLAFQQQSYPGHPVTKYKEEAFKQAYPQVQIQGLPAQTGPAALPPQKMPGVVQTVKPQALIDKEQREKEAAERETARLKLAEDSEKARRAHEQRTEQAGLRKEYATNLQHAMPYVRMLESIDSAEHVSNMIFPLLADKNVGLQGTLLRQWQNFLKQIPGLAPSQRADATRLKRGVEQVQSLAMAGADPEALSELRASNLFNPQAPVLDVLSGVLVYLHAAAIKSANGGTGRITVADIREVKPLFDPHRIFDWSRGSTNAEELQATLIGLQAFFQSGRQIANRMVPTFFDPENPYRGMPKAPSKFQDRLRQDRQERGQPIPGQ